MSKVVNLGRARKDRARAAKRAAGDANAVKHGRTKAERQSEEATRARDAAWLDAHRHSDDEPPA